MACLLYCSLPCSLYKGLALQHSASLSLPKPLLNLNEIVWSIKLQQLSGSPGPHSRHYSKSTSCLVLSCNVCTNKANHAKMVTHGLDYCGLPEAIVLYRWEDPNKHALLQSDMNLKSTVCICLCSSSWMSECRVIELEVVVLQEIAWNLELADKFEIENVLKVVHLHRSPNWALLSGLA